MLESLLALLSHAVDVLARRIGSNAVSPGFDHRTLGLGVRAALDEATGASLRLRTYQRERQFAHKAAVRFALEALLDGLQALLWLEQDAQDEPDGAMPGPSSRYRALAGELQTIRTLIDTLRARLDEEAPRQQQQQQQQQQ
jgi:hypothetical protein